jgi:periplasmic protein TonB
MRKYTLIFSVVAHVAVIAAVYIAPAFATIELPEPLRTTAYIVVQPTQLPDVPPPIRRTEVPPPVSMIPTRPPDGIQPERPVEPIDQPPNIDPGALVTGGPIGPIGNFVDLTPTPPPVQGPKPPMPVGGLIEPPKRIGYVAPIYPPIALAARKEGLVILQTIIDEDGIVRDVKVLRSDPLFDQAAMDAVKQWRFTSPMLNKQKIPVTMTVTVGFSLNK